MKDVFEVVTNLMETTNEGFKNVDKRFNKVDKHFDRLEGRMDNLEDRMDSLEGRMDKLDSRMDSLERRIGKIEELVEKLQNEQIAMSADIKDILMSLDKIEIQIENNTSKNQELEEKLLKLHEWCIEAGQKIGISYPKH